MKLVGDAFKQNSESIDPNQKVVVLGISDWGTTARKETLIRNNVRLTFYAFRSLKNRKTSFFFFLFVKNSNSLTVEYELTKVSKSKQKTSLLDPSHSHFLLVDDAVNYFGGEVDFRNELETELAKKHEASIVLLVIAGGPNTLKSVLQSVKNGTPCVFLDVIMLRLNNF